MYNIYKNNNKATIVRATLSSRVHLALIVQVLDV